LTVVVTVPSEAVERQIRVRLILLTNQELGALKPREKAFKVTDRDGMYVAVLPSGTISFRYDYRLNGRRETLGSGRYDPVCKVTRDPDDGTSLSLRESRTLLDRARRDVERGVSPAQAKAEKRTAAAEALTFGGWAENYFKHKGDDRSGAERIADSTLAMPLSAYRRAIEAELGKLRLEEVTPQRLKRLCDEAKEKRGPAVAVHVREIVSAVFNHAQGSGLNVSNPAEAIRASAIATSPIVSSMRLMRLRKAPVIPLHATASTGPSPRLFTTRRRSWSSTHRAPWPPALSKRWVVGEVPFSLALTE
jgi:hypothetical protein